MQTQWQTFLIEQGGKLDAQQRIRFDQTQASLASLSDTPIITGLDHYGLIQVSGDDARSFLQAQFSNDINLIDSDHVQFSAYCNPKGRMLAQFLVIPHDNDYLLVLPREILDKTLSRLRMFVLRSAVTLTDISDSYACFGILSANGSALPDNLLVLPPDPYSQSTIEQAHVIQLPAPVKRYLIVATLEKAQVLWQQLAPHCQIADASSWDWADIQAGLPSVWTPTVEEFVPQMMNLELIGGVSFKKGCYPGQEIVARMHYLGKPKRRMFRLHTEDRNIPAPGTDIYLAEGETQSIGKVVLAQASQDGGVDLLAVLLITHINNGNWRLGSPQGPVLALQTLPYEVDISEQTAS